MDKLPLASPPCGSVRGSTISTSAGVAVNAYKGIPYAAAPIGPLRWRAPAPAPTWSGVRDTMAFGPDLPQAPNARLRGPSQNEDCLYLNVWAPASAATGSLPVMVWIHGGGFVGGSGSDLRSDGAAMAAQGVVVVSFNYRSGLFGFLAHPALSAESDHGVSGNYGLLDQIAALAWVRDNIAAFGGNPRRVTAFGVSAGSASISLLLTSAQASGLFHQAILHSPGACRPLATLQQAEQAGLALGQDIAALRQLGASELFQKTGLLAPKVRGLTTPRVLRPIRDGWLLKQDEREVFKAGQLHPMPLIVGSNADEGSLLTASWPIDTLDQYRDMVQTNFGKAATEVFALYPAQGGQQARQRVGEIFADTQFNYGTRLLAQSMARLEPKTWRYLFKRRRPHQTDGPHHGEEVAHVFGNVSAAAPGETADHDAIDEAVSASLMSAWVSFARSGNPNGAIKVDHAGNAGAHLSSQSGQAPFSWPPYDAARDTYACFADTQTVERQWRQAQLDFLDRFYDEAG